MTERYMRAYYHEFTPTGVDHIDAILEAIALAGKGCHNTEDWREFGYWDKIQEAADTAARY